MQIPSSEDLCRFVYTRNMCEVPTVPDAIFLYHNGQPRINISGQAPVSETHPTYFSAEDSKRMRLEALIHLIDLQIIKQITIDCLQIMRRLRKLCGLDLLDS